MTGAVLGLALGLLYGLVSGYINSIVLAGVPLRVDTPAVLASTIFAGLGALAAGYIAAWPQSSLKGILGGAGAIALFRTLQILFSQMGQAEDFFRALLVLVPSFLPSVAFALPITALMRLGVNGYGDAMSYTGRPRLRRLAQLTVGALALGVFAGSLSLMSSDEQAAVRQVNTMVKNALAPDADVPAPLRSIDDVRARAGRRYTLSLRTETDIDFTIAGSSAVQMHEVEVLFDNGFRFKCRMGQSLAQPFCTEE
jgi:hypothetical protein